MIVKFFLMRKINQSSTVLSELKTEYKTVPNGLRLNEDNISLCHTACCCCSEKDKINDELGISKEGYIEHDIVLAIQGALHMNNTDRK